MNSFAKYRIFIDESGNPDMKSSEDHNQRFLSLTGAIFDLKDIDNTLNIPFENFKNTYFSNQPDKPIILHRNEIVRRQGNFEVLKDVSIESNFNNDLLRLLKDLEYTVITVVIDKSEHLKKYSSWHYHPYHYCLMVLLERFILFLEEKKAKGDVMIEARGAKEDNELKKIYGNLYEKGTKFVDYGKFKNHLTSKRLKVKPKKSNISGLQIADLLAHPSRKEILRWHGYGLKDKYDFGNKVISIIKLKYYKASVNWGFGRKFLP